MITCRQCGSKASESTDVANGVFKCGSCGWRELRGSVPGRPAAGAAKPKAGTSPKKGAAAPDPEPAKSDDDGGSADRKPMAWDDFDLEALRRLERADFAHWCGGLFERFGYRVRVLSGSKSNEGFDADLVAERDGEEVLVDCVSFVERENVGRPECQRLVGAMLGAECRRAMIVGPGAFERSAKDYVERLADVQVEFVDGERLEQTLHEMRSGPLRIWWGRDAA